MGFTRVLGCVMTTMITAVMVSGAAAEMVRSKIVTTGLALPVFVTSPPGDTDRLFVVEQGGLIRVVDRASGAINSIPFLDVRGDVIVDTPAGKGLLGLAFHPNFNDNGLFYVNMTVRKFAGGSHATNIREYRVSDGNPDVADPTSGSTILRWTQPHCCHNGGWMDFGPNDGMLYISSGDTGTSYDGGADLPGTAQDTGNLLGTILRIDVNGDDFPTETNRNYAIPESNPFVGVPGSDEIWAYGLRNPWRASFDRSNGDLYIADVGQGRREEIDFQHADSVGGANYGWRLREGNIETPRDGVGGEKPPGAVDPVYEYMHGEGQFLGRSVTGGYVYRGPIESLQGQYFFGDFINNKIWSIEIDRNTGTMIPGSLTDHTSQFGEILNISSFGEDSLGNLYMVSYADAQFGENTGSIYTIVSDPTLVGDLTGDHFVDFADLTILLANWNQEVGPGSGNIVLPNDSKVDFADLTVLLSEWTGPGAAGSPEAALGAEAVPEPSASLLAIFAMVGLGWHGRQRRSRSA